MNEKIEITQFVQDLKNKLDAFDFKEASLKCYEFIKFLLRSNEPVPLDKAEKVLQLLRNKRMFNVMQEVADTLLQTNRITYKIQRQFAQSLIDSGNYSGAIYSLHDLVARTRGSLPSDLSALSEYAEARGLIGRVYKQLYINGGNAANPQCIHYLSLAINSYYEIYRSDNTKTWHGINTVALLERAARDKVALSLKLDARQISKDILNFIEGKHSEGKADEWDFATAAEACLALDKRDKALKWLSGYARMPRCDAFELASTLRQLEEVWQLDLRSPMGQSLLPLLRSELMKRQGGQLTLGIEELKRQQANEDIITKHYGSLVEQTGETEGENTRLEKVFGEDSFKTYKWYMQGAARCLVVARIGLDSTRGSGTGFLLRGKDLKESWGKVFILLTNAHVVSKNPADKALSPDDAIVIFEALDSTKEFKGLELLWSSPRHLLDATVLKFSNSDQGYLESMMKDIKIYPVSISLPGVPVPPSEKVYIIGHPRGGTLQISFQDNLFIDHDNTSKIHYRTPTEPGSSGSPLFNKQWDLIGLHHSGSDTMPCLNGKPGFYKANEGIWIQSIIKDLAS